MSKITQSAKHVDCIRCRGNAPQVCARHYNGLRQHAFGKGRSVKAHDMASAELCDKCESDLGLTEGVNLIDGDRACKSVGRSEEFMYWCMMTNIRRYEEGRL